MSDQDNKEDIDLDIDIDLDLDQLADQELIKDIVNEDKDQEPTEQEILEELAEYKNKYLRALADFENFKKRSIAERSNIRKYEGEAVFRDLINIADNFEFAINAQDVSDLNSYKQGVEMIYKMLLDLLTKWDVKQESALGQTFDPNIHSALSQQESAEHSSNEIIAEIKKAYVFKDKLLRPAEVVVAINKQDGLEEEE